MSKAVDRRYAAIKAFSDTYRPKSNKYRLIDEVTVETLASEIEKMRSLGRTDRWHKSLDQWVAMINEYPEDREHVEWAVLQGGIYAGSAAE